MGLGVRGGTHQSSNSQKAPTPHASDGQLSCSHWGARRQARQQSLQWGQSMQQRPFTLVVDVLANVVGPEPHLDTLLPGCPVLKTQKGISEVHEGECGRQSKRPLAHSAGGG